MKNLKKLTRNEMKNLSGGSLKPPGGTGCGVNSNCSAGCQEWRGGKTYCSSCCMA